MSKSMDSRRFDKAHDRSGRRSGRQPELYRSKSLGSLEIGPRRRFTGSPAYFRAEDRSARSSLAERALDAVRELSLATGRSDLPPPQFTPDPTVHRTSAGRQIVHLYQHYQGVPVFEGTRTVQFDSEGRLVDIVGDEIPIPPGVDLAPQMAAGPAAAVAARHVAEDWKRRRPSDEPAKVLAAFPLPSRPSVLEKPRIEGMIRAHLTLFYRGTDLALAWLVALSGRPDEIEHNVIIGARGRLMGEVLYCSCTTDHAKARALVFRTHPGEEDRVEVSWPLPLAELPAAARGPLPADFPFDWVESNRLKGNNTRSHVGNKKPPKGSSQDGELVFSASPEEGMDQRAVNAFYFCNYLHDFFFLLGFDESEQNFQEVNFTGVPGAGDELIVRSFPQRLTRGASISKRADGSSLEIKLGIMGPEGNTRPASLDADVVFHEYAHGVTNRVVGGRLNFDPLRHEQSHALAEGFCDYFAITIQNFGREPSEEKTTLGSWLLDDPAGFRQDPYDESFPAHFGDLGGTKSVHGAERHYVDPHDAGEIWCAALVSLQRRFGEELESREAGHRFGWQLVVDSLKLIPTGPDSPSFLDARNALDRTLEGYVEEGTLEEDLGERLRGAMLSTFLKFGMGPDAFSPGATFDGIVADLGS